MKKPQQTRAFSLNPRRVSDLRFPFVAAVFFGSLLFSDFAGALSLKLSLTANVS
jgi:hypothetical protein